MNNPEFEPDILEGIDQSGYSEKELDRNIDKKGTVRQAVKQINMPLSQSGTKTVVTLKNEKKTEVIFQAE